MAAGLGFDYNQNKSKGTQRSGTEVTFPKQFLADMNEFMGGPFTTGDLFRLAPRATSMFGNAPTEPNRAGGGYNLGFGLPAATKPPLPDPNAPPADPNAAPKTPQIYGVNDVAPAWNNDPDKLMDLWALSKRSGGKFNPEGFTRDEYADLLKNLHKYGFSGRSEKNFIDSLALLQSDDTLGNAIGGRGGRGSGVFN